MDVSNNDHTDESQATQLLQQLLDPSTGGSWKQSTPRVSSLGAPEVDMTPESLPSSRSSNSAPKYQLHGLAPTQTETQAYEDGNDANEGSQKENLVAQGPQGDSKITLVPSNPVQPAQASTSKFTKVAQTEPDQPTRGAKPRSNNTKTVSLPSPRTTRSLQVPTTGPFNPATSASRSTLFPRAQKPQAASFEDASQDSFAGVTSQDLEKKSIATWKQFQVPLSELGKVDFSTDDSPPTNPQKSPSMYSSYGSPLRKQPQSPDIGTVLVAATPSNSGSSQSQSQDLAPTQQPVEDTVDKDEDNPNQPDDLNANDMDVDAQSQGGYESSAASSAYSQYLKGPVKPPKPAIEMEATQPSFEPTQPSEEAPNAADSPPGQSAGVSSATPGHRHLLNLVPENIRYRYTKYNHNTASTPKNSVPASIPTSVPTPLPPIAGGNHRTAFIPEGQETQPSCEEDLSLHYELSKRDFPKPSRFVAPTPNADQFHQRLKNAPSPTNDAMDIVPDSEPMQEEPSMPSTSSRATATRNVKAKSPLKRSVPVRESVDELDIVSSRIAMDDPLSDPDLGEKSGNEAEVSEGGEEEEEGREGDRDQDNGDDDDDDVPLSAMAKRGKMKGKIPPPKLSRVAQGKQPARGMKVKSPAPPVEKPKKTAGRKASSEARSETREPSREPRGNVVPPQLKKYGKNGRSWETGEVPSSVPEQDMPNNTTTATAAAIPSVLSRPFVPPKRTIPKAKAKPSAPLPAPPPIKTEPKLKGKAKAVVSKAKTTVKKKQPPQRKKQRIIESDDEDDESSEEDDKDGDYDPTLIPKTEPEDEERTEPADEEYAAVDLQAPGQASRKRKRSGQMTKVMATRKNSRASMIGAAAAPSTDRKPSLNPQPSAQSTGGQAKRLRSMVSEISKIASLEPTKVFALWKQDGHYYSGVVYSHQEGTKYRVKFDDDTEATVNIDQLRPRELRVGDEVLPPAKSKSTKVMDVSKLSQGFVGISIDDEVEEVEISALRIGNKTIAYGWKDRILAPDIIVPVIKPVRISPTPSRLSMASAGPSGKGRRNVFANTGLIVTFSAGNENGIQDRETVVNVIKQNGGIVVEDWANIIRTDGKHTNQNRRWIVTKADMKWIGKDGIERVFLLADDANQKPKFLIALALGVPCLSMGWLHDSVDKGEEQDWLAYLLPQGYSEVLEARPSQQVDIDWGNSIHHVKQIMCNPVASKLFSDCSILCVGSDMVPQAKGRKVDEKSQEASNAVVRIIMAMGANSVEAVTEVKYAVDAITSYDYVVIRDEQPNMPELREGNLVFWTWVKNCLIASRLVPLSD